MVLRKKNSECIPLQAHHSECIPLQARSRNPSPLPQFHSGSQHPTRLRLTMALPAVGFNVTGIVHAHKGKAVMTLAPEATAEGEVKVTMTRPSTSELLQKIEAGLYRVHESRQPLLKRDLTTMMGTIQRALRLQAGQDGEWTANAQQRLESLLANPKRSTAAATPLPLEDKKPSSSSATAAPLALEDKKTASSGSMSDSDSSSSSSSDSDDPPAEGPQQQPPSSPDVAAELALTKTKLEEKDTEVSKWKEEFDGIFSALHRTSSELEQANKKIAQQEQVIAKLSQENATLRRQLQPQNTSNVAADVPMSGDDEPSSPESSEYMTSDRDE